VDADQRFAALYQDHYAAVLRYDCRRTDLDSARDVVAETYVVVWWRLADVSADPADVPPWLYGVARRILANSDRSRRRSEHLTARLTYGGTNAHQAPDLADGVTERAHLQQALQSLPELDQEVLRLVGREELDQTTDTVYVANTFGPVDASSTYGTVSVISGKTSKATGTVWVQAGPARARRRPADQHDLCGQRAGERRAG
jgi:RNA polymerase sigma-70 factor (ECF subfamily)